MSIEPCIIVKQFKCKECGCTEYSVVDLDIKKPIICCDSCGRIINNDDYDIFTLSVDEEEF